MIKKEWGKPRVRELDVLMTESSFDDLAAATGLYFLVRDDYGSNNILPIS